MKSVSYLALALLFAGFLFYSCKKPGSSIPNYPIDADLKAAFNYQPGTYWIYRDSISGEVDSFAIRTNVFGTGTVAGNYTIDGIGMNMTEYASGSLIDTSEWVIQLNTYCINLIWYRDYISGLYYFQFNPGLNYPFKIGRLTVPVGATDGELSSTTNIFNNYELNGQNYVNVAEIEHLSITNNVTIYDNWLYVNSDVGIIKMRINDFYDSTYRVWEIQRQKIIY